MTVNNLSYQEFKVIVEATYEKHTRLCRKLHKLEEKAILQGLCFPEHRAKKELRLQVEKLGFLVLGLRNFLSYLRANDNVQLVVNALEKAVQEIVK